MNREASCAGGLNSDRHYSAKAISLPLFPIRENTLFYRNIYNKENAQKKTCAFLTIKA